MKRLKRKVAGRQAWLASLREWHDLKVAARASRRFANDFRRGKVGAVVFESPVILPNPFLDTSPSAELREVSERGRERYAQNNDRVTLRKKRLEAEVFRRQVEEVHRQRAEERRKVRELRKRMGFRQLRDVL